MVPPALQHPVQFLTLGKWPFHRPPGPLKNTMTLCSRTLEMIQTVEAISNGPGLHRSHRESHQSGLMITTPHVWTTLLLVYAHHHRLHTPAWMGQLASWLFQPRPLPPTSFTKLRGTCASLTSQSPTAGSFRSSPSVLVPLFKPLPPPELLPLVAGHICPPYLSRHQILPVAHWQYISFSPISLPLPGFRSLLSLA